MNAPVQVAKKCGAECGARYIRKLNSLINQWVILNYGRPWGYLLKDKLSLYFTRSYRNSKELFLFENGRFDLCLTFAHLTKETRIINGSSHLLRAPVFCWGHPYESRHPAVHIANKNSTTDLAILEGIRLLN